jgi:hypothetical protein
LEQHCAGPVQPAPSRAQVGPLHTPPLQSSPQQSLARWHGAPSARHSGRHTRAPFGVAGSHRPLAQSARVAHGLPGAAPALARQVPASQRSEQQSEASPHASPSGRQSTGGAATSQRGSARAASPSMPVVPDVPSEPASTAASLPGESASNSTSSC